MSEEKSKSIPLSRAKNLKKFVFPDENKSEEDFPCHERIGCFPYLCICNLPDIAYSVNELS